MSHQRKNSTIIYTQNSTTYYWKAEILWEASKNLEIKHLQVEDLIKELDKDRWFQGFHVPTVVNIMHHFTRVMNADLSYPIIVTENYSILDGTHRLVKAILSGEKTIKAVILTPLPDSDQETEKNAKRMTESLITPPNKACT